MWLGDPSKYWFLVVVHVGVVGNLSYLLEPLSFEDFRRGATCRLPRYQLDVLPVVSQPILASNGQLAADAPAPEIFMHGDHGEDDVLVHPELFEQVYILQQ